MLSPHFIPRSQSAFTSTKQLLSLLLSLCWKLAVGGVAVFGLATIIYLTALSLDISLALDLFLPPIGAREVPTWPPPYRRQCDKGNGTSRTWRRIGGISWICGHPLPCPLQIFFSSSMTSLALLLTCPRRNFKWEVDIPCTAPRSLWLAVAVLEPCPYRSGT